MRYLFAGYFIAAALRELTLYLTAQPPTFEAVCIHFSLAIVSFIIVLIFPRQP